MAQTNAMSVSLTKNLKEFVKSRSKSAHFGTPSAYIRSPIRDDLKKEEQEKLERELLKGLRSGKGRKMTPKKYEQIRKGLRAKKIVGKRGI